MLMLIFNRPVSITLHGINSTVNLLTEFCGLYFKQEMVGSLLVIWAGITELCDGLTMGSTGVRTTNIVLPH